MENRNLNEVKNVGFVVGENHLDMVLFGTNGEKDLLSNIKEFTFVRKGLKGLIEEKFVKSTNGFVSLVTGKKISFLPKGKIRKQTICINNTFGPQIEKIIVRTNDCDFTYA